MIVVIVIALLAIGGGMYWYETSGQSAGSGEEAKDWSGTYEFTESTGANPTEGPNFFTGYKLTLTKEHGIYDALIDVDGHMTLVRIKAHAVEDENGLAVIFDAYRPENQGSGYTKGDVLFTLGVANDNELKIDWQQMKPSLPITDVNASYFVKGK